MAKVDLKKIKEEGFKAKVSETVRTMPNVYAAISNFADDYLLPQFGEIKGTTAYEILKADPSQLERTASKAQRSHTKLMVEVVKKNLKSVYEETSEEFMSAVVGRHIGDNNYKKLQSSYQNKNGVRDSLKRMFNKEDSLLTDLVKSAGNDAILKGAENMLIRTKDRELKDEGIIDSKGKFSIKKAAKYSANGVKELKSDVKDLHYKEAGFQYAEKEASNDDKRYFQQAA